MDIGGFFISDSNLISTNNKTMDNYTRFFFFHLHMALHMTLDIIKFGGFFSFNFRIEKFESVELGIVLPAQSYKQVDLI